MCSMLFVVAFFAFHGQCEAAARGAGCPCKATPASPQQTAATGKPAFVGIVAAYGWGCDTHDHPSKGDATNTCQASQTAGTQDPGEADDWCLHEWCIVDPDDCDVHTRLVTYTAATDDYFSYEACDTTFAGNGWVGRCLNCDAAGLTAVAKAASYCSCGGTTGCPCLPGDTQQTAATGKPAYVGTVPAYGYGCKAHDKGEDTCATATDTAAGEPNDWCLDEWCQVDPENCAGFKTRLVTYTTVTTDYFSYETCDTTFEGNGWVGRCEETTNATISYIACTGNLVSFAASGMCWSKIAGSILVLALLV